jgi:hypothetical protein
MNRSFSPGAPGGERHVVIHDILLGFLSSATTLRLRAYTVLLQNSNEVRPYGMLTSALCTYSPSSSMFDAGYLDFRYRVG